MLPTGPEGVEQEPSVEGLVDRVASLKVTK